MYVQTAGKPFEINFMVVKIKIAQLTNFTAVITIRDCRKQKMMRFSITV